VDRPLHVQVAEAIGAEGVRYEEFPCHVGQSVCLRCSGVGDLPSVSDRPKMIGQWMESYWIEDEDVGEAIPSYDLDWSATGPLLKEYGISLAPDQTLPGTWGAWVGDFAPLSARDPEPLVAVCLLILEMNAAGWKF
jgi:hypothetical protein